MSDRKSIPVLVVEDTEDIAEILVDQLRADGFEKIDAVSNGLDAYNRCVRKIAEGAGYGLIISDFKMPKMTGLEFLRKVRSNTLLEEAKFIMITAFGEEQMVKEAVGLKVDEFITKPFQQDVLSRKIEKVFAKKARR